MKIALLLLISYILFCSSCISTESEEENAQSPILENPVQTSVGTLTLHSDFKAVSLSSAETFNIWNTTESDRDASTTAIIKEIYKVFKDEFDFIFFISNNISTPSDYYYVGKYLRVKNSVSNIGMWNGKSEIWDDSALYGSPGKLQGMVHFTFLRGIQNGPSLHELAHHWGVGTNWIPFKTLSCTTSCVEVKDYTHWGFSTVGGHLHGMSVTPLGGDKYSVTGFGVNSIKYSPMEQYVMGLIPLNKVPPFIYYTGLWASLDEIAALEFHAATENSVTCTSININYGSRIPSYTSSQKSFRILTIVFTPNDLTDSEWDTVNSNITWFSQTSSDGYPDYFNFWEATEGKATLKMDELDKTLK
jgi:hypothetical protein